MTYTSRENWTPLTQAVMTFMSLAGQSTDKFNARQACLYTGLQLEEMAEKIEVIMGGCLTTSQKEHLGALHSVLKLFAAEFRDGLHQGDILRCDHAELIDADFDTAWVSIGALASTSPSPGAAIAHGTHTNMDKFRGGIVQKDENGKVKKPADWQRPDFEPYIDTRCRV